MTVQTKQTMPFEAEVGKLLQLLAKSLYPHSEIFMREVISNASDALEKVRFSCISGELTGKKLAKELIAEVEATELAIDVSFDKEAGTITIEDNGIGMSREELIDNLGTLARSGTQQFLSALEDAKDDNFIGQFGVGFYSVFMVSDKVAVTSVKLGTKDSWCWESDGSGSFDISKAEDSHLKHGTRIVLHVKPDMQDEYLERFRLSGIITQYSNHIRFPINMPNDKGEKERINDAQAIWKKEKSQITPEEHADFFKSVAHVGGSPWLTLHNKNEGRDVSFVNLLYVPSVKPFDLFHPERRCSIQLYVKGVFVTEDGDKVSLLPRHLRFIKGIVDSDDLPLNINRDSLQQTSKINSIRNSLTKRILGELKKIAANDEDKYKEFWDNFGSVVKEGLCESLDTEGREQLLEICRFASSTHKFTSIPDYISRMAEGQKNIYYLLGDSVESMMRSPQIEGFLKKGVEVLLLPDSVDDFWTHVVFDYNDHKFKSVTDADVSPEGTVSDKIEESESVKQNESGEAEGDKQEKTVVDSGFEKFANHFAEVVGPTVSKVVASKKLTTSPACLVVPEGGFNMRMERFLIDQKQLGQRRPRILELNKSHPVVEKMIKNFEEKGDNPDLREYIKVLFDCVCIAEGEAVSDSLGYAQRSIDLLNKVI